MRLALGPGTGNLFCVFGTENLSIDLKSPLGKEVFAKLIRRADVFCHNYRPSVMASLGVTPEDVWKINPDTVYVYAASYGSTGPWVGRAAYDPIPSSITGAACRQAGSELPPPPEEVVKMSDAEARDVARRVGLTTEGIADPSGGLGVATAALYGLFVRERTGKAPLLETTMVGSTIYANSEMFDQRVPIVPSINNDGLGTSSLYRQYKVQDGWVFLAAPDGKTWEALRRTFLAGGPGADLSVSEAWLSLEVSAALERAFADRSKAELVRAATEAGIPMVELVEQQGSVITEPWLEEAGLVGRVSDTVIGHEYRRYGRIIVRDGDAFPAKGGTSTGENSVAILRELGCSDTEIEDAIKAKIVRRYEPRQAQMPAG